MTALTVPVPPCLFPGHCAHSIITTLQEEKKPSSCCQKSHISSLPLHSSSSTAPLSTVTSCPSFLPTIIGLGLLFLLSLSKDGVLFIHWDAIQFVHLSLPAPSPSWSVPQSLPPKGGDTLSPQPQGGVPGTTSSWRLHPHPRAPSGSRHQNKLPQKSSRCWWRLPGSKLTP